MWTVTCEVVFSRMAATEETLGRQVWRVLWHIEALGIVLSNVFIVNDSETFDALSPGGFSQTPCLTGEGYGV